MNIYEAIMKAADVIEQHWERYDYGVVRTPACGSPACMWGHIGAALGMPADTPINLVADKAAGVSCTHLYNFFDEHFEHEGWRHPNNRLAISSALRLYAAKYHAPVKPRRTDSDLVSELMARVTSGERIPEDA